MISDIIWSEDGDTEVICPHCGTEIEHCDEADWPEAANAAVEEKCVECDRPIWIVREHRLIYGAAKREEKA